MLPISKSLFTLAVDKVNHSHTRASSEIGLPAAAFLNMHVLNHIQTKTQGSPELSAQLSSVVLCPTNLVPMACLNSQFCFHEPRDTARLSLRSAVCSWETLFRQEAGQS